MHGNSHHRNHYLLASVSSSANRSRQQLEQRQQRLHQQELPSSLDNAYSGIAVSNGKLYRVKVARTPTTANQLRLEAKLCTEQRLLAAAGVDNVQQQRQTTEHISRHLIEINQYQQPQHTRQEQQRRPLCVGSAASDQVDCAMIGAPEAAAGAMVSMVRLILVILICVLLVKLRTKPKSSRSGAKKRVNDSQTDAYKLSDNQSQQQFEGQGNIDNDDDDDEENLQCKESNAFDLRYFFNLIISRAKRNEHQSSKQHLRRLSQPELLNLTGNDNQGQEQQQTDKRHSRNSDTSVAHLSFPPGPMGLPFLGYLPFVGQEIHLTLTSLSEHYGPIYQIFLGGIRVVVLNDASLVRQAFKQPVFSGRPDTQLTRILQGYGIVNSDGALWKEQRAFLHSALRKLGAKSLMSGSNGLEAKIQNQVKEFVNDLSVHAEEGKPCQARPIVARAVSSVVGSIVMNLTYRKYEEKEKFDRLIELMQEGFRLFTIAMPLDFIPIFRFLPGVSYAYSKMKKNRAETSAFFQGVADEHRRYLSETFNLGAPSSASSLHPRSNATEQLQQPSSNLSPLATATATAVAGNPTGLVGAGAGATTVAKEDACAPAATCETAALVGEQSRGSSSSKTAAATPMSAVSTGKQHHKQQQQHVELENIVTRDLVDAYIVQQKKHEKDGKENYFSDQQLVQIMSDIFSAGLETVTSTIEWSILFLILNPECQEQIQQEIDRIIGRDRMPQLEDLSHMPYTEATIYEVLRRSNVIALGNAHATLADASIGGFRIPKGTQVLPNLYGIHMNPKLWDEPDRFNPSRFIVNERAQKPDYFIPFSVGRRMCLGDVLAKMEVFLFLVGLLQKYDLSVAEEDRHCPPQVKGTIGVSNTPAPFRFALKPHKQATKSVPETKTTMTTPTITLAGDDDSLKQQRSVNLTVQHQVGR